MELNKIDLGLGSGTVYQIANRGERQMMSYLIKTPDEKIVMIDGGFICPEDGTYLYETLRDLGGKVDVWFISHAHEDHFGALLWMLENKTDFDIQIGALYFSFPPIEWLEEVERNRSLAYPFIVRFLEQIRLKNITVKPLLKNAVINCGGISFEVLNDCSAYEEYSTINDTTIVLLAHFLKRDILFLGDLGEKAGERLIKECDNKKLRCDIVQMAHHGQNGANKKFYEVVKPKICLYTAPGWLWENNNGGGRNSGPWKTLETREWMKELEVEESYPMAYGDYIFY